MIKWVSFTRRRLPLIVCLCAFALYLRTLAPSVAELFDDSLEFQLVGYKLAIAHPTGYPLYTLILKLFMLLPVGEIAYRANLSSAVLGALAVGLVYRIALKLTGAVVPSLVSAAALAVSPVFWSQAVIAEVYALNAVLIAAAILFVLSRQPPTTSGGTDLAPLAFLAGLMLTHHRTGVLLLPAAAVYLWLATDRDWRALLSQACTRRSLAAFLLPLTLYAYLPLRGDVGSLDGTYQNTPEGFLRWISASGYNIFLTGNPFNRHYDAAFFVQLFLNQFGWPGLIFALIGVGWLLRRKTQVGLFLLIAFGVYLVFVISYHVPDVQVFAIPAFLIVALALGCGLHAIINAAGDLSFVGATLAVARPRAGASPAPTNSPAVSIIEEPPAASRRAPGGTNWLRVGGFTLVLTVAVVNVALIFEGAWAANDLSGRTEVRDYGRDMLAQPLPAGATLVGILGEMTLVRYLQFAEGLRPSLVTIAADRDAERLAVIDREIGAGRAVFTTRPLDGLPEKYSLGAFGTLVRVLPRPQPSELPGDSPRVADIRYRVDGIEQPGASLVRVNMSWEPTAPISADLKVSARLMDGGRLAAQNDDWPVHNAYHTTFWRAGELIRDAYDLMLPPGTRSGTFTVLLIVYRAGSGAEVGHIEAGQIEIRP